MLLVILGAGASWDCDPGNPGVVGPAIERMPLTQELVSPAFREVLRSHPAAMPLVGELRRALASPERSLEAELQRLATEAELRPLVRRQILSFQLYLAAVIGQSQERVLQQTAGLTTYVDLVQELERWRDAHDEEICVVAFNYDTLIEQALEAVLAVSINSLDAYMRHENWKLIKVHGSTSWYHRVDHVDWDRAQFASDEVIAESYDTITIDATILGPGDPRSLARESDHHYLPAIALPTLGKGTFVCPLEHRDVLRASIGACQHVLVVGWRGADKHFVKFCRDARRGCASRDFKSLMVVDRNGDEARSIRTHLQDAGMTAIKGDDAETGFASLIFDGGLAALLPE